MSISRTCPDARQTFRALQTLLLLAAGGWLAPPACGEDVVILRDENDLQQRRPGKVVDYTGEQLLLEHPGGRQERIAASRVVDIVGDWSPSHRSANTAFDERRYQDAEAQYRQALRDEERRWARRRVLARLVWCYRYLQDTPRAAQAFLTLYRDDPTTPYFDAMPLQWVTAQPEAAIQQQATAWLKDERSVARLLGASWLLTTAQRSQALQVLERLAADADARVVFLAEAQRWRTQVATANEQDLARWRQRIESMPEAIRAGPYFALGQALAQQGQSEQAAMAFLRPVILHPAARDLTPDALLAAARELERMKHATEAAGLYRELIADHPGSRLAADAQRRLEQLQAVE